VPFEADYALPGGAVIRLRHTGHILGAASVEVTWAGSKIVFSGDLGRYGDPTMLDPTPVKSADYLVVESTYGDRRHDPRDPQETLHEIVSRTIRRAGTVIIPSFAVGRAQALLFHIYALKERGRLAGVPIYLNSPMAIDATDILHRHIQDQRLTAEVCARSCGIATYTRSVEASKALDADPTPKVIISASGMATGGRVLHHLKRYAPDPRNTILFSGFQAAGTRGAAMLSGADSIKIHGEYVPVRAEIASLPMLSAHADANEIIRWLSGFERVPRMTYITHGEPTASDVLRRRIQDELGWTCQVPEHLERAALA
jgi:metallo-beta-lactamase family protein